MVVTAYHPSPDEWEPDVKTRKGTRWSVECAVVRFGQRRRICRSKSVTGRSSCSSTCR